MGRAYWTSAWFDHTPIQNDTFMPTHTVELSIAGKPRPASTSKYVERKGPLDQTSITRSAAATVEDATAAVDAAASAFESWSITGPSKRRELLLSAANAIQARTEQAVETMMRELGSTRSWAHRNIELARAVFVEAASLTTRIGGEVIPSDVPGNIAMAIRQPAGVVLSIAPWNAPLILAARAIAVPLACGNTVVLKASEICPATHALVIDALIDAGFPSGTINFVTHDPADAGEIVEAMISHPSVRRVNFTGSTHVGRIIAQMCAKHLKPSILELGGKAPLLVLDDADVDAAVKAAIFGAFGNSGQVCMSTERLIVDSSVADAFAERFAKHADSLRLGDPRQTEVVLGSVVDQSTLVRCRMLIDDAVAQGAVLLCGGLPEESTLMPATVLDHVTPSMRVFREETFAPLKCIVRATSEMDAVRLANDCEFGLSAAVFSRDIARAWNVVSRLKSGICHINGPTVHDEPQMPFGGVKASGWGHFGGQAGIDAFTDLRWITTQIRERAYPF